MRKISNLVLGGLLISGLFFSGCSLVAQPADVATESPVQNITGKVSAVGGKFSITSGVKITEITSRKVDLSQYDGKTITVTGEFSGTTLYVDSVK